jgi:hypothetical protein
VILDAVFSGPEVGVTGDDKLRKHDEIRPFFRSDFYVAAYLFCGLFRIQVNRTNLDTCDVYAHYTYKRKSC